IDTRTGKPWIDNERLAWVDPFREEVWAYNIAIAREAVRRGFDEVQFDYVRFPTDGKLGAARYARPNNKETRLPKIAAFLESVRLIRKRSTGSVARVRPWLQDFKDYAFDRRIFGVNEVQAQIRAAEESGGAGWMLWNPRNDYTGAALRTKNALAAR